MEFTKYEKRLLDPRFPGRSKAILVFAIILLFAAVAVLIIGSRYTEKVRKPYQDLLSDTQKIVIQSQREEVLKRSLIQTIKSAELGWYEYAESERWKLFESLLFLGVVFLVSYWHNLRVHHLLKKLNSPRNNSLQPTAKSCVG